MLGGYLVPLTRIQTVLNEVTVSDSGVTLARELIQEPISAIFLTMRSSFLMLKFIAFCFSLPFAEKMEFVSWWRRNFESPAPHFIKMRILDSAVNVDIWIETGTFMGRTTNFLRKNSSLVISIEPSEKLAANATQLFEPYSNVRIVEGLSENVLDKILCEVRSKRGHIAFWLDGHFSGGTTHLGPIETPIQKELEIIAQNLQYFEEVSVFIDDFRCFAKRETDYPSTDVLSAWARENGMSWSVEHDIFIARNGA